MSSPWPPSLAVVVAIIVATAAMTIEAEGFFFIEKKRLMVFLTKKFYGKLVII